MTYITTDIASIIISLILTNLLYYGLQNRELSISSLEKVGFLTISTIAYITMFLIFNVYEDIIEKQGHVNLKLFTKMTISLAIGTLLIGSSMYFMQVTISRLYFAYFILLFMLAVMINRMVLHAMMFRDSNESQAVRNIVVVGQSKKGREYIAEIKKHEYLNLNIVGYVHIKRPNVYENIRHLGSLDDLDHIVDDYVVDEIAVARPLSYDPRLKKLLQQCQDRGITITMVLDIQNTDNSKVHVAMVGNIPVLKLHTVSLNESQMFAKRALDIVGALAGMVLFGIAYAIVGPLIKMETPGPVIFKQDRVGKNGRVFKVWKFRSMGVNAEEQKAALMANNEMDGHMFKMTNDPRITKIGGFIRKTSIDELPQFYNVLKGDMSLVGTRPPTVNEVKNYELHHHKRICITPGITGNWQVSGRSEIENFEEVVRLDADYIAEWSVWLDIQILVKTVLVVFKREGSK